MPTLLVRPDLRSVQNDITINDTRLVEVVDDFLGTANDLELFLEVVILENGSRLELLCDTALACSRTLRVGPGPYVFESAGGIDLVSFNTGSGSIIGSSMRHFEGGLID